MWRALITSWLAHKLKQNSIYHSLVISLSGELVGYLFKSSFGNEKLAKRMLSLKDERSRLFRVGSYVAMTSFVFPNKRGTFRRKFMNILSLYKLFSFVFSSVLSENYPMNPNMPLLFNTSWWSFRVFEYLKQTIELREFMNILILVFSNFFSFVFSSVLSDNYPLNHKMPLLFNTS